MKSNSYHAIRIILFGITLLLIQSCSVSINNKKHHYLPLSQVKTISFDDNGEINFGQSNISQKVQPGEKTIHSSAGETYTNFSMDITDSTNLEPDFQAPQTEEKSTARVAPVHPAKIYPISKQLKKKGTDIQSKTPRSIISSILIGLLLMILLPATFLGLVVLYLYFFPAW